MSQQVGAAWKGGGEAGQWWNGDSGKFCGGAKQDGCVL